MSWQFWSSVGVFALFNLGLYGYLILKVKKVGAKYRAGMSHDNPDGPCECGATHMLSRESCRKNFSKAEIRKQILNVIRGCEEEIEATFREIKGWMKILEDPP
jgi:hypothetical protein